MGWLGYTSTNFINGLINGEFIAEWVTRQASLGERGSYWSMILGMDLVRGPFLFGSFVLSFCASWLPWDKQPFWRMSYSSVAFLPYNSPKSNEAHCQWVITSETMCQKKTFLCRVVVQYYLLIASISWHIYGPWANISSRWPPDFSSHRTNP